MNSFMQCLGMFRNVSEVPFLLSQFGAQKGRPKTSDPGISNTVPEKRCVRVWGLPSYGVSLLIRAL